jgi:hypothetical protein
MALQILNALHGSREIITPINPDVFQLSKVLEMKWAVLIIIELL